MYGYDGGTAARRDGGTAARRHGGMTARRRGGTAARWQQRHRGAAARMATLVVIASLFGGPVGAQTQTVKPEQDRRSWLAGFSHHARWPALAGAAAFTAAAAIRHDDADQIFRSLLAFCRSATEGCRVTAAGTYADPNAEALFAETVRLDRQARLWLVAGQVTLAAAGGMFLIDLMSGHSGPKNIPYTPFSVIAEPRRVGLRLGL